jgi:hypothetical protein
VEFAAEFENIFVMGLRRAEEAMAQRADYKRFNCS